MHGIILRNSTVRWYLSNPGSNTYQQQNDCIFLLVEMDPQFCVILCSINFPPKWVPLNNKHHFQHMSLNLYYVTVASENLFLVVDKNCSITKVISKSEPLLNINRKLWQAYKNTTKTRIRPHSLLLLLGCLQKIHLHHKQTQPIASYFQIFILILIHWIILVWSKLWYLCLIIS